MKSLYRLACLGVALPLVGCALEEGTVEEAQGSVSSVQHALESAEWNVYASSIATPGGALRVSVSSRFSERLDVLVEVVEPSGVVASGRMTMEADYQYEQVMLELPATVSDPDHVSLVTRVLPVGGSPDQALDTKTRPLGWPAATPIPGPLYYGGSLNAWNVVFVSPVGNHGSQAVEVRRAASTDPNRQGPFEGAYAIQSFSDAYGLFKTNYGLNLQTGQVYKRSLDATQPQRGSLVVLNPPATRDELAAYAEILDGLRSAVRWNANFNQGSEWPQLRETLAYLDRVSGSLYARFGEFVQSNDASYASELTAGKKNGVSVAYGAGTERDVLVDLLVNGTWVAGGRRTVSPGSGSTEVSFDVPAWIRPMTRGMVYVKLVPVGAPWTAKITELGFPVSVLGPDQLRGVYAPAEVAAGSSFDTNGYFEARQGMDIRADLFDASGRWLTGVQTAGTLWFESGETSNYNYKVSLTVPQLPSGSELTLYTKLLPTGAQWYSMVDEEQQKIIIE